MIFTVQAKYNTTRLSGLESTFSEIDVNLDINNKLLHALCDATEYAPTRCVIVSTIPYNKNKNIVEMIQNIFTNGLHLHINKRLNGFNKSGTITPEIRHVEYRHSRFEIESSSQTSHISSMNGIYIRPVQSALE